MSGAPDPLRAYFDRGWSPVPVPYKSKAPTLNDWQRAVVTPDNWREFFNGDRQNIGVLLGGPSNGLTDIDLDAPEAVRLAPRFLPDTACRFGRPGKPESHWLYICKPLEPTRKFPDIGGTMLLEFRATGAQTIFPGSVHPSGELIEWGSFGEPGVMHGGILRDHAARLAAACLLTRHWPQRGSRHDAALALAGALLRAGWLPDFVEHFLEAVAIAAGDDEVRDRVRSAVDTAHRKDAGRSFTGWPTVEEIFGRDVARRLREWLLPEGSQNSGSASPAGSYIYGEPGTGISQIQKGARFQFTRLGDLLAEEPESVQWLWLETLPAAGMSLLTAKPKVGKTTLAINLALAVARGESFLGRAVTKGRVLYLALEEKRSEVQRRFAALGASDEDVFVHTAPAPEAAMEALTAAVYELKPALVIIDPLLKLVRLRDVNDYAEVNRALEPVLTLARASGAHIMALHHQGKFVRDDGDDILGSTAFFGACDTSLEMRKKGEGRTLRSTQRYGTDIGETVVTMDQETGSVSAAGSLEGLLIARAKDQILKATDGQALTKEGIREAVEGKTTITVKAFGQLKEAGAFIIQGSGKKGDPFTYQRDPAFAKKITDSPLELDLDTENSGSPVPGIYREPEKLADEADVPSQPDYRPAQGEERL